MVQGCDPFGVQKEVREEFSVYYESVYFEVQVCFHSGHTVLQGEVLLLFERKFQTRYFVSLELEEYSDVVPQPGTKSPFLEPNGIMFDSGKI